MYNDCLGTRSKASSLPWKTLLVEFAAVDENIREFCLPWHEMYILVPETSNLFIRESNFTVAKGLDMKFWWWLWPSLRSMKIAVLEKDSNYIWNINWLLLQFYYSRWELCFGQWNVWQFGFGKGLTSERSPGMWSALNLTTNNPDAVFRLLVFSSVWMAPHFLVQKVLMWSVMNR